MELFSDLFDTLSDLAYRLICLLWLLYCLIIITNPIIEFFRRDFCFKWSSDPKPIRLASQKPTKPFSPLRDLLTSEDFWGTMLVISIIMLCIFG